MGSSYLKKIAITLCVLALCLVLLPPMLSAQEQPVVEDKPEHQLKKALAFRWDNEVSAAVFTRGNILWTVFDQAKEFDIDSFITSSEGIVQSAEPIKNRYYTIIRFELDRPRDVYVQKYGLTWLVHISKNAKLALDPIQVETVNKPPALPHIFLGVNQANVKPVRITDPVIGDEMLIIPLLRQNLGIAESRRYVDFEMMRTAQGVALQLFTDEVKLYPMQSAINITSPSMELANKAPRELTAVPIAKTGNKLAPTLLPFDEWAKDDPVTFRDDLASLEQAVLDAAPENRSKQRLKLAQFFLAQKFAAEALGLLNVISIDDPKFAENIDVKLAKGVAAFLARRYLEAEKAFASIPLLENQAQQEEVGFWNLAVKAKLNDKAKISPFYLQNKDKFVTRYPLWLRQNLALTAAEQHIMSDDLSVADQTMTAVNELNGDGKITNDITFLKGLFAAHHNQSDKAIALWEPLTKDVFDRYNRTRAQMALVELLLSEEKIDTNEAIKRLNSIRNSWRGDELERNILKILGQLYINSGDYVGGLRVWREIVTNFPNTPDALYIATKMTQTFIYLFNQGGADTLSPLSALALYYEFKELTPIGEQRDMMVQNIANRLFQVDLLDQAAILLTHQVRYRLKGEEKVKLGTRLAMLHLWNKRPELALEVLDVVDQEGRFPGVGIKRDYLRAQALENLGRYQEALKVLENDSSDDANTIKMDVYWKMERWDRVVVLLMPKFRRLTYKDRFLTPAETNELLRLTTVYTLQQKKYALHNLYLDFKDKIPAELTAAKKTFDFLAGNLDAVDYKDIEGTMQLGAYQGFLEKYRTYAKDNGLEVLDAPSPPADGTPAATNASAPASAQGAAVPAATP